MGNRDIRIMLGICTALLILAFMYLARSVVAPTAIALFLMALVWPLQAVLQARMPQLFAMAITLVVTITVIIVLGYMIFWGFSQAGQWLIANAARVQVLYVEAANWLDGHGLYTAGTLAESFNIRSLLLAFQRVATNLQSSIVFAVVVFVFVMLGLLEIDIIQRNLASEGGATGTRLVSTCREIAHKLRKYMAVRTLMSLLTGLAVWAFTSLIGLELAPTWGVITFALNYIPFIGPLVAALLPTVFSLVQYGSFRTAATIFIGMNLIQFFSGSYIEPRFAGATLAISPFAILLAVFFWGFMWGLAGAFIGVQLTIAAFTICEQSPSTRWIAQILSGRRITG